MSEDNRVTTAGGHVIVGDRALEPDEVERYVRLGVTYEQWLETISRWIDRGEDKLEWEREDIRHGPALVAHVEGEGVRRVSLVIVDPDDDNPGYYWWAILNSDYDGYAETVAEAKRQVMIAYSLWRARKEALAAIREAKGYPPAEI